MAKFKKKIHKCGQNISYLVLMLFDVLWCETHSTVQAAVRKKECKDSTCIWKLIKSA